MGALEALGGRQVIGPAFAPSLQTAALCGALDTDES
jgi:hypothetical protein